MGLLVAILTTESGKNNRRLSLEQAQILILQKQICSYRDISVVSKFLQYTIKRKTIFLLHAYIVKFKVVGTIYRVSRM